MNGPTIDPGPTPELAWLPVERLRVDHRYQRSIESDRSQRLIKRITAEFRWLSFQAILATIDREAPDGPGWLILDGQHRTEAARRVGIKQVPAVVVTAADVAEQAQAFVRTNLNRVTINQFAIHHARVASGDEGALDIDRVCRAAGLAVPKYPIQADRLEPGQTLALGTIAKIIAELGVPASIGLLKAIAGAWRQHPGYLRASLFKGVALIVAEEPVATRADLYRRLGELMKRSDPVKFYARAMRLRYEQAGVKAEPHAFAAIVKADLAANVRFDAAPTDSIFKPPSREQLMGRR